MKFSQLCVAGALTLEVLSRGVNFASALKHDASNESTSTHLMRKDSQVLKNKKIKESFKALHGHRALEDDTNLIWEPSAENLWERTNVVTNYCEERGLSMSGDGKTFAIACKEDNSYTGMVKVYSLVDGQWAQKGDDIVGQEEDEYLGSSVALSDDGSILAIGIKGKSTGSKTSNGCIEVYKYENNVWTLMGDQIEGENYLEFFGEKVSLSADGNIVAGSGSGNVVVNGLRGFVRVYQFVVDEWKLLGEEIAGQNINDKLGSSLSLSDNGKVMAVGIPYTDEEGDNTGSFSVYEYDINGVWLLMGDTLNGETTYSQLGYSIQLSGDGGTVIVGTANNYVIVYRVNNENQWKQIGEPFYETTDRWEFPVVSISKDGNTIVVPSPYEDGDKGVVRVYKYSDNKWDQLGEDIHGTTPNNKFGSAAVLSGDGNTLVAAGKFKGASVYKLTEKWNGVWYINYDSTILSGNVLTSTYLTKPDVDSDFTVSHTLGTCDSNGSLLGNSVITKIDSNATAVDDEISDKLDVAKTMDAAAIVEDHNGSFVFCETITLTNTGVPETETVNVVHTQSQYTVTADFLVEFDTYSVTLEDDSEVTNVDEQSLSPEGIVTVKQCADLSDIINPGDKLCLEIYVSDSTSVGVETIHNLDLEQGTSTFIAIDDGVNQYEALVDVSCDNGTCTVVIVVPDTLFVDDSDASTLTLSISGDAYLYNKGGEKNSENESKGFNYHVQLEKPCEVGFLRGFVNNMLSN